ncbi:MAG: VCBS repeat-containing protein, partial [Actinobacteria bacterium]|nr:VCBS repeat-containing protein [Actinomycetota bacterium]
LSIERNTIGATCIYNSQFTADTASSTCTASASGVTASTSFKNGQLVTLTDAHQYPTEVVAIPDNPSPNTRIDGLFYLNGSPETFTYVFNEQVTDPVTGALTVYATHLIARSPGEAIGDVYFGASQCGSNSAVSKHPVADFTGGGRTAISVFRPGSGTWFVRGGSPEVTGYGTSGDIAVPGDYDGDGQTDVAVFRPSVGTWYVHTSGPGPDTERAYGADGDVPAPGDYDGDGKTDIAVFRPSQGVWYIHNSTGADTALGYGANGDIPVPGDYDGDGKTDIAVFRPSQGVWYIHNSGGPDTAVGYGGSGDMPVPGDYDGDGKADVAVFRPGQGVWYIHNSTGADTAVGYG